MLLNWAERQHSDAIATQMLKHIDETFKKYEDMIQKGIKEEMAVKEGLSTAVKEYKTKLEALPNISISAKLEVTSTAPIPLPFVA